MALVLKQQQDCTVNTPDSGCASLFYSTDDGVMKVKYDSGCISSFGAGALTGVGVPTMAPDYIGQEYIDTSNCIMYVSVGKTCDDWRTVEPNIWGTGCDGSCTITTNTQLQAREYEFDNLIICPGVTLTFCGNDNVVLKATGCFCNAGTIDLKGYGLTDCSGGYLCYGSMGIPLNNKLSTISTAITAAAGGYNYYSTGGSGGTCGEGTSAAGVAGGVKQPGLAGGDGLTQGGGGGGGGGYSAGGNNGAAGANGIGGCGGTGGIGGGSSSDAGRMDGAGGGGGGRGCICGGRGGDGGCRDTSTGNGGNGGNGGFGILCGGGAGGNGGYGRHGGNAGNGGNTIYGVGGAGGAGGGAANNGGNAGNGGTSLYGAGGAGGEGGASGCCMRRRGNGGSGGDGFCGGNGGSGGCAGGNGGNSCSVYFGLGIVAPSIYNNCIIGCGAKGGNGAGGYYDSGNIVYRSYGGHGGDGADVLIIYKNSLSCGTISIAGGEGGTGCPCYVYTFCEPECCVHGAKGIDGTLNVIQMF